MKKIISLTLTMCIGLTLLSGCASNATNSETNDTTQSQESSDDTSSNIDTLTLTYVTSPLNVPSIVDKNQGIYVDAFNQMGIEVSYAEITSGADQTQALASGDVQILNAVGATSVISSAANGADIKILDMYSRSPEAFTMISRDDTVNSPKDLIGKTVAGPVGTNLHQLLIAYLDSEDVSIDDVNYVNMSIPDARAGLEGGSVDVALLAGPTAYNAQKEGYHLVATGDEYIDALIAVAVTQEFYDNNQDVIEQFLLAQNEVATFMEKNYDETIEIVASTLELEEDAVKEMYEMYDFSTQVSDSDIQGFQTTADFMLDTGMIENYIDVNDLFID